MRWDDIEEHLGYVPQPEVEGGAALLGYFFRMGPATANGPLEMREVRAWAEPLTGYDEWPGWQAELFVRMSRAYCAEQHRAREYNAAPPIPEAVKMWQWVQSQKGEGSLDREERRAARRAKKLEKS